MKRLQYQKFVFYAILLLMTAVYIGPFIYQFFISISQSKDVFGDPVKLLQPPNWTFQNYANVWVDLPFKQWLFNSLFITLVQTIMNVFFSALAGFVFARLTFPGRKFLFGLLISSLTVPVIILLVPKFIFMNNLRLVNTYAGLILPNLITITNIFLMKQFFETIPKDLEEAALIDGCSYFRIFWQIFLPVSTPALAAVAIYTFQGSWNEFLWPVTLAITSDKFTLPVGVGFLKSQFQSDWPLLMAGTLLITIPTLCIFLVFQRYFVQGVAASGGKE
ncbi:carbohydrate ABC transporter permease [Spirosoma flavus]